MKNSTTNPINSKNNSAGNDLEETIDQPTPVNEGGLQTAEQLDEKVTEAKVPAVSQLSESSELGEPNESTQPVQLEKPRKREQVSKERRLDLKHKRQHSKRAELRELIVLATVIFLAVTCIVCAINIWVFRFFAG